MNHKKLMIGIGIVLAVILISAAVILMGGNLLVMIRTHLGM